MRGEDKTKEELIGELACLRREIAEKESQKSEVKYQELLEHIPAITYIATLGKDSARIYVSPQIRNLLGFLSSDLTNTEIWHQQLHPDDLDCLMDKLKYCQTGKEKFKTEYRMLSNDGSIVWFFDEAVIIKDDAGNPLFLQGVMYDITEQKKVMDSLRDNEERYRLLVELSPDMIAIHDGEIIYANKAAVTILGVKNREELIGKPIIDFIHPQHRKLAIERMQQIKVEKKVPFIEQKVIRSDGKIIDVDVAGVLFTIQEKQVVQLIARDITERKRIEQEIARFERLNLVGKMAASIGHEIRNPMTAVRGFLQMLEGKADCFHYKDFFELMIEELDRANLIINEFLSLAKNKPLNLKMHDLNSIVKVLYPLIQANAINTKKYVKIELGNIPELLLDEKEMRQLIMNLVRNGLEAMDHCGSVIIKTYKNNDEVVLSVQDQGKGIDHSILDKIGTPFFTTKENGTGLGIAVCYGIAANHKATVDIDTGSTGTTFFIRFKSSLGELGTLNAVDEKEITQENV